MVLDQYNDHMRPAVTKHEDWTLPAQHWSPILYTLFLPVLIMFP